MLELEKKNKDRPAQTLNAVLSRRTIKAFKL